MPVEHVVILMLENRSFDEYFGTFPGANGFHTAPKSTFANAWVPSPGGWTGPPVLPYRLSTFSSQQGYSGGCNHGWGSGAELDYFAAGAMNGWSSPQYSKGTPQGNPVVCMGYFSADDIPYHWWLAQNFALCDNYFSSCMGPTEPNRLYMISGTIGGMYEFLSNPTGGAPGSYSPEPGWLSYPDLLTSAGVPWTLYDQSLSFNDPPDYGGGSPGPSILNPLYYFPSWTAVQSDPQHYKNGRDDFFIDAATKGGLAKVSWIVPDFQYSEHPTRPPWDGPLLISQILESLLTGPNWSSTVLIVTYDEPDGHFDHVPPPQPDPATDPDEFVNNPGFGNQPIGAGFRVPTFVVSPWTVGRGICSDPYDHTSIVRFLEDVTGVSCPYLTTWRRNTFRSLSSIGFGGAPVLASRVPARPPAAAIASNAFSRAQGALTTPICACPTGPTNPSLPGIGWQPDLSPGDLVPMPQTWPPLRQRCEVTMTIPSYSQRWVLEQAKKNGTGNTVTFPDALKVVVNGFEPLELTTPFALEPRSSVPSASPPNSACVTRVPIVAITNAGGGAATNLSYRCTGIDLDPSAPGNQTPSGVPQRFTFTYSLTFENIDAPNGPFSFPAHAPEHLTADARFQVDLEVTSSGKLTLSHDHLVRKELAGKIAGLLYDHFGDFEGFILETESGELFTFHSRESHMEELVRRAWAERLFVSVIPELQHNERPRQIVLRPAFHA